MLEYWDGWILKTRDRVMGSGDEDYLIMGVLLLYGTLMLHILGVGFVLIFNRDYG